MEVQGLDVAIDRLIETIKNARYISVDRIAATDIPLVDKEDGFTVKWI